MPIEFACAACGKGFKVEDGLAGRRGKCPGCGSEMRVPTPDAPAPAPGPRSPRGPAGRSPSPSPSPLQALIDHRAGRPAASGPGIAGVVLGVVALLISWLPLVNLLVVPLCLLGGVSASVGLVAALANKRSGPGWAVAGLGINALAVAAMLISNVFISGATARAIRAAGGAFEAARAEQEARRARAGALAGDARKAAGDGAAAVGKADPGGPAGGGAAKPAWKSHAEWLAIRPPFVAGETVYTSAAGDEPDWLALAEDDIPALVAARRKIVEAFILSQATYADRRALSDSGRIVPLSLDEAKILGPVAKAAPGWRQIEIVRGDKRGVKGWVDDYSLTPARLHAKRPTAEAADVGRTVAMDGDGLRVGLRLPGARGRHDPDSACFIEDNARAKILEITDGAICLIEVLEGEHKGKRGYAWKKYLRFAEDGKP